MVLEQLPSETGRIVACVDSLLVPAAAAAAAGGARGTVAGPCPNANRHLEELREHQARTRTSRAWNFFSERNPRFDDLLQWPSPVTPADRPSPLKLRPCRCHDEDDSSSSYDSEFEAAYLQELEDVTNAIEAERETFHGQS
jgi:hypothetical protein